MTSADNKEKHVYCKRNFVLFYPEIDPTTGSPPLVLVSVRWSSYRGLFNIGEICQQADRQNTSASIASQP